MEIIDKLRKIVINTTTIFDNADIRYWLDFGTLLGAVRDGDIISWDTDADIGYYHDDRDKLIVVLMNNLYYIGGHQLFIIGSGRLRVFYGYNLSDEPWLDLYAWKDISKGKLTPAEGEGFPQTLWPDKQIIGGLTRLDIEAWNKNVSAPEFYGQRLKNLYKDWRTPVKRIPYWG